MNLLNRKGIGFTEGIGLGGIARGGILPCDLPYRWFGQ